MSQLLKHYVNIFSSIDRTRNAIQAKASLLESYVQVRYRKMLYIRKYREPDYQRKEMLAVCEPIYRRDSRPDSERCAGRYDLTKPVHPIHPYDKLLAEDYKRELASSRMVCFLHVKPMKAMEKKLARNMFEHENMFLRSFPSNIVKMVIIGSKFESSLPLFCEETAVLYSPDTNVSTMLKLLKKMPQLLLLAGIIDDRFLSVKELKSYSNLPKPEVIDYQLSQTLSMSGQSLINMTNHPMVMLVNNLNMYIKDKQKK